VEAVLNLQTSADKSSLSRLCPSTAGFAHLHFCPTSQSLLAAVWPQCFFSLRIGGEMGALWSPCSSRTQQPHCLSSCHSQSFPAAVGVGGRGRKSKEMTWHSPGALLLLTFLGLAASSYRDILGG
jgi:hypothetical protein